MNASITNDYFGTLKNNQEVKAYTLTNRNGITIEILNYGGIIRSLNLPDRNGKMANCVLGFDRIRDYEEKSPYFGALIGRYGNRIAEGKFTLDGTVYSLAQNHGIDHLHGGNKGFDKTIWTVEEEHTPDSVGLILTYQSPHMEEGYPGTLTTQVIYRLTNENKLTVDYSAQTDRPTILNLTQHSYFNLSGNPKQNCLDHHLTIKADAFLAIDDRILPTGEKVLVQNTPFDFNTANNIGEALAQSHEQLRLGKGFDHCYCFPSRAKAINEVAKLMHPKSGRTIRVATTTPGMQLYTGNHLTAPFVPNGAVCLETQAYPDSPNQSDFPSTILRPGEFFSSSTHFHFTTN